MIKFYQGPYQQHGAGFGGFFKGLMNFVRPVAEVLKPVINSPITQKIAKEVVKTGIGIGSDMSAGKSFKDSVKQNLGKAKKRVASAVYESMKTNDGDDDDEDSSPPPFKKSRPMKKRFTSKKVISSKYKTILD